MCQIQVISEKTRAYHSWVGHKSYKGNINIGGLGRYIQITHWLDLTITPGLLNLLVP